MRVFFSFLWVTNALSQHLAALIIDYEYFTKKALFLENSRNICVLLVHSVGCLPFVCSFEMRVSTFDLHQNIRKSTISFFGLSHFLFCQPKCCLIFRIKNRSLRRFYRKQNLSYKSWQETSNIRNAFAIDVLKFCVRILFSKFLWFCSMRSSKTERISNAMFANACTLAFQN